MSCQEQRPRQLVQTEKGGHSPVVWRVPFFYGWVMLPVAMIAHVASSPGQTVAVAVFNESFRDALSLNHRQLTGAYMLGTLLACLPTFFVGAAMDRYGIRRTMTVVVLFFGCACFFTSQVKGLASLFVAFVLLRMLGHGAFPLLADNTLAMWFRNRLGMVSGVKNLGWTIAIAIVPSLILWLIRAFGWRWAYAIFGLVLWVVMLPLLAFLFRNRPEDIGQLPDGTEPGSLPDTGRGDSKFSVSVREDALRLYDAVRTRAYWIMLVLHAVVSFVWAGIIFNIVPLFESHGFTQTETAATFVPFAVAMGVMQLIGGIFADRLPLNLLMSIAVACMTLGVGFIIRMDSAATLLGYAITFGAGSGLVTVVESTLWARYFGRDHLGKIRGTIWTATVAGSSVGPFVMGASYDYLHSYDQALLLKLGLLVPLIIVTLFATPPRDK